MTAYDGMREIAMIHEFYLRKLSYNSKQLFKIITTHIRHLFQNSKQQRKISINSRIETDAKLMLTAYKFIVRWRKR